jgi:hypothetical protein
MQHTTEQIPSSAVTYVRTVGEDAVLRTDATGQITHLLCSPPWPVDVSAIAAEWTEADWSDHALDEPADVSAVGLGTAITIVAVAAETA